MRRQDDGHASRQTGASAPFRVLASCESPYLSASSPAPIPPPPPRAPEPYKVAPASTSYARAHRRSSFVIIAEARPATPESRSPSPTLNAGRVSPFRGRGFKGPPPRSKSRPQSPENVDGRRRRYDRRASLSQQNSPRRSLIPQPTRRRSTSLSKTADSSTSPKIGRRVDSRNRLNAADSRSRLNINDSRNRLNAADSRSRTNIADTKSRLYNSDSRNRLNVANNNASNGNGYTNGNNVPGRRQVSKLPTRLSPIQGTPTKPDRTNSQSIRRDRSRDPANRKSPTKIPRQTSPPKSVSNPKRFIQERSPSKDRLSSPSKIPLKSNKFGSTSSLNANRFITAKPNGSERTSVKGKDPTLQRNGNGHNGEINGSAGYEARLNGIESNGNSGSGGRKDEIGLMELLKKSSGATGTSSVVSTTTTTAVQPLHIDANTVLIERDADKRPNPGNQAPNQEASIARSSNSTASKDDSPVVVYTQGGQAQRSGQSNDDSRSSTAQQRGRPGNRTRNNQVDVKGESPVGTDSVGGHSKTSSVAQSVKSLNRTVNGLSNGTGSATQNRSANKIQNAVHGTNEQNARNNRVAQKASDDNHASASQADNTRTSGAQNAESVKNAINKATENSEKANAVAANGTSSNAASKNGTGNGVTNAQISAPNPTQNSATNSIGAGNAGKTNSVAGNSVAGAVNVGSSVNSEVRARNDNRGSNASLKSSTGMSAGSIESVRSTDTGVSVDTVRGVSSPREKTGVHVVKRSQEIETLSGNVMHLEQNGEPAVLAGSAGVEEERAPKKLLTRWGRALDRYCKCCPSMRCLACRRDPKGLLWARKQTTTATTTVMQENENAQPVASPAMAAETVPAGCWDKFKSGCRCTRLREAKWCARRARIAPAEGATCCPPERRFGAMCRRLFSCSKCKRADVQRTKSIRAKHSLTSVAPPPLSEEPKAKIPDVLVEHNSLMRGAIPCLPVPLAWFCFIWNLLLPGTGTVWSGLFNLCVGQPRFSQVATFKSRLGSFIVNLIVGVGQLFTVLFCLVGWGWSIWWGVTMIRLARKYKRFKASEAANGDPEARAGEPAAALPPGVPSQALRGMERAR